MKISKVMCVMRNHKGHSVTVVNSAIVVGVLFIVFVFLFLKNNTAL